MGKAIRSRTTSDGMFSVVRWMAERRHFLNGDGKEADIALLLRGWDVEAEQSGTAVAITIDRKHGPRLFDAPIVAFMRLATAFSGSTALNPVGAEDTANRRLYPVIRTYAGQHADTGASIKSAIYLDRITTDAQAGRTVKERGVDYRDRTFRNLRTEAALEDRPSKYLIGMHRSLLSSDATLRWSLCSRRAKSSSPPSITSTETASRRYRCMTA